MKATATQVWVFILVFLQLAVFIGSAVYRQETLRHVQLNNARYSEENDRLRRENEALRKRILRTTQN